MGHTYYRIGLIGRKSDAVISVTGLAYPCLIVKRTILYNRGGPKFGFAELWPKDSARLGNVVLFGRSSAKLWCYLALFFLHAQLCTLQLFTIIFLLQVCSTLHFLHLFSICSLAFNLA